MGLIELGGWMMWPLLAVSVDALSIKKNDEALVEARLAMKAGKSAILVRNLTRTEYDAARTAADKR